MATNPSFSSVVAFSSPTIAFRVDCEGAPAADMAGRFLAGLSHAMTEYYLRRGMILEGGSPKLTSIQVGSLIGELVAVIVDNVSLKDARDALAGFVPMLADAVSYLTSGGRAGAKPSSLTEKLINTIAHSTVYGDVTQTVISNPNITINGSVIINLNISKVIVGGDYDPEIALAATTTSTSSASLEPLLYKVVCNVHRHDGRWFADMPTFGERYLIVNDGWDRRLSESRTLAIVGEPIGDNEFHVTGIGFA